MKEQPFRLKNHPHKEKIHFTFNNKSYHGYAGDTLASALLANGVNPVARSFKYHRCRGIFSNSVEEPNALIQLEPDASCTQPNIRATEIHLYDGLRAKSQNCWPNVKWDLGAIAQLFKPLLSAGFYYKTFKKPQRLWPWYEKNIRKSAGLGKAPAENDPDHYARHYAFCDVLVIGGGCAGLSAARCFVNKGLKVIICEQKNWGGFLNSEPMIDTDILLNDEPASLWVKETLKALNQDDQIILLSQTVAFGHYTDGYINLLQTHFTKPSPHTKQPRQTLWQVRAKSVIHATGQIERPLLFPGNDRPGIMLAQSTRYYLHQHGVVPGKKVVIFTNNDQAYQCALELQQCDIQLQAIIDVRNNPGQYWFHTAQQKGISVKTNAIITNTKGVHRLQSITIKTRKGYEDIACDLLAISGGFDSVINLWSHADGQVVYNEKLGSYLPGMPRQKNQFACGGCNGTQSYQDAMHQANQTASTLSLLLGKSPQKHEPKVKEPVFSESTHQWCLIDLTDKKQAQNTFIDMASDVTVYDIQQAVDEGFCNVEHAKRYTTCGMAPDQGKTSNVNLFYVLARLLQMPQSQIGTTTFRPPYTPITFGAIAGFDRGENAIAPNRTTALHDWHIKHDAVFENVGHWWRARYYKAFENETMDQAVLRESYAARQAVGMLDGSTLGKIDIQGPDAAEFLNRIYTNGWKKLQIGRCRYGVMLGEDGMVMDDGVTARLSQNHFHMTTTTGNAAIVLSWMERWLQTEWTDLTVYLTSVTEQWGVISISGPKSFDVLHSLLVDKSNILAKDISPLDVKTGTLNHNNIEIPIRIFGVAFSGEIGYEINVPTRNAKAIWAYIYHLGQPYGITPYGTETMHLLRAEKGFIIIGQETDGTITPYDLDMSWVVNDKKSDFIGKRSLYRSDTQKIDRKQLVGLLPEDKNHVIPEGTNIIASQTIDAKPVTILGHVTSSYYSPNLKRSFALALIKQGKDYPDKTVYAAYPEKNQTVAAKIVDKTFL
ncbi:2Fe-2S iron-sulfur cluster-binding protein [Facilibium subflavum]|uniref:2Fe-2S iron-sulfur cluster-binding protein n=1 Tax=Facilibium subflavum TaxID=2219058 RepID=UPI000E659442|nr:2Fe-2S iron-sulfur cluster-binding protein [Facilibium subflavum]